MASGGGGQHRSVGCHDNTTGPAPGAAGFQEGAPALPPGGHPTLPLSVFLPLLTKHCFSTNYLPGTEVGSRTGHHRQGPCSQGARILWW